MTTILICRGHWVLSICELLRRFFNLDSLKCGFLSHDYVGYFLLSNEAFNVLINIFNPTSAIMSINNIC